MDVTGQFSLGYPRADGGEQIDARVRVTERPLVDFREAFDLQDYDVDGMLSGDFHVYGDYERPHGFGSMTIARGIAYDEPFSEATAVAAVRGRRRAPQRHRDAARAAARSMAPPMSAGPAPIRSTSPAAASRSTR